MPIPTAFMRKIIIRQAYDLYLIFKEVVKHNEYFDIASKASSYIEYKNASGNLQAYDMSSTDEYLTGEYALPNQISLVGGKTGTTRKQEHVSFS